MLCLCLIIISYIHDANYIRTIIVDVLTLLKILKQEVKKYPLTINVSPYILKT